MWAPKIPGEIADLAADWPCRSSSVGCLAGEVGDGLLVGLSLRLKRHRHA
jgi:hypothetical protein